MNQHIRRARRFFWWCAAADAAILDAPETPRLDGIKYAAVGALVCLTTTVAMCGWTHNAATMMADQPFGILVALGLGLLMGAVVFCMERVLVVSIRQDASLGHKLAAFTWRGLIASLAAALVATPFALAYFNNGILAHLDNEKLTMMTEKRRAIDGVYGLKEKAAVIASVDRDLVTIRAQRDQLPIDIEALSTAAAECKREEVGLQQKLSARIAAANWRYAAIMRQMSKYGGGSEYFRQRLAAISKTIAGWRSELAAKAQACRAAAERFASARQDYYARLDQERQQVLRRKQAVQSRFDQAQQTAAVTLAQSDAVVARVTAPDLSARIRALGQMAARDRVVAIVLAIAYAFFFLIDIMPVLAKLVMRTTYDRRISGEYRRAAARIEADATLVETEAAMRAEIAKAERLGLEALLYQTGSEAVMQLARLRVEVETEKAEATAPFAPVSALIDAGHRTHVQADDFAERYAGRPDLFRHIEAVREALAKAMTRAAAALKPQSPATPAA